MRDTSNTDQMTVEAETVEDALAEISAHFGQDAEIMRALKVHRGGVGGFFAKEMVQLTARRRRDEASAPLRRPQPETEARPQGGGIADVLERMAQSADAEDSDFRTMLQRELAADDGDEPQAALPSPVIDDLDSEEIVPFEDDYVVSPFDEDLPRPVAVGPALQQSASEPVAVPVTKPEADDPVDEHPAATVAAPEQVEQIAAEPAAAIEFAEISDSSEGWWRTTDPVDAPTGMGPIAWSTTALLRLGLPAPIIAAVADLDPRDDMAWINQIAATVAPHCGPLPEGDIIVVGPHVERLAEPLGLPLIHSGDMAPYAGSFCAMVDDSPEDRRWLEFVRGGRGIHLVIGDEPWQDLLIDEPVAVSWVGETSVGAALYLAFTLGATLGFGTVDGFVSSMVRAQPTDVALAVRRIVRRR